ncbi:MAG: NAD(P)-dependent oxidoreductase, partial [Mesorhizobium sp.]
MASVAFLGLGVMGYPMAGHLRNKGGHDITVYNRTTAKAEQWVAQHGGRLALTPAEAVVLSMKTEPVFMAAKAPLAPVVTERRSSSLPTQEKT